MKLDLDPEVIGAIENGQKIKAIKILRLKTGMGLKEAKHSVENYIREYDPDDSYNNASNSGIGKFIVLVALVYFVYWFFINNLY